MVSFVNFLEISDFTNFRLKFQRRKLNMWLVEQCWSCWTLTIGLGMSELLGNLIRIFLNACKQNITWPNQNQTKQSVGKFDWDFVYFNFITLNYTNFKLKSPESSSFLSFSDQYRRHTIPVNLPSNRPPFDSAEGQKAHFDFHKILKWMSVDPFSFFELLSITSHTSKSSIFICLVVFWSM